MNAFKWALQFATARAFAENVVAFQTQELKRAHLGKFLALVGDHVAPRAALADGRALVIQASRRCRPSSSRLMARTLALSPLSMAKVRSVDIQPIRLRTARRVEIALSTFHLRAFDEHQRIVLESLEFCACRPFVEVRLLKLDLHQCGKLTEAVQTKRARWSSGVLAPPNGAPHDGTSAQLRPSAVQAGPAEHNCHLSSSKWSRICAPIFIADSTAPITSSESP